MMQSNKVQQNFIPLPTNMIPSAYKCSMKLTHKAMAALEEQQEKTAVKRKNNWDEEATPKKAHLTP